MRYKKHPLERPGRRDQKPFSSEESHHQHHQPSSSSPSTLTSHCLHITITRPPPSTTQQRKNPSHTKPSLILKIGTINIEGKEKPQPSMAHTCSSFVVKSSKIPAGRSNLYNQHAKQRTARGGSEREQLAAGTEGKR